MVRLQIKISHLWVLMWMIALSNTLKIVVMSWKAYSVRACVRTLVLVLGFVWHCDRRCFALLHYWIESSAAVGLSVLSSFPNHFSLTLMEKVMVKDRCEVEFIRTTCLKRESDGSYTRLCHYAMAEVIDVGLEMLLPQGTVGRHYLLSFPKGRSSAPFAKGDERKHWSTFPSI